MQYGYTIVYVPDVVKTMEFYQAAFGFAPRFIHETNTYAELETGSTRLAFAAEELRALNGIEATDNRPDTTAPGIELAFVTADVHVAYQKAVTNGAVPLKEPVEKPWGQIVGYVRDCNGLLIEICTPVG